MNDNLSKHFSRYEFRCSCHCGGDTVDWELLEELEDIRGYFERLYGTVKIGINSGYRCKKHNSAIGGSVASLHTMGKAVDFVVYRKIGTNWWSPVDADTVADYLESNYQDCYGIGRYDGRTHFDVRSGRAARWDG
ncbi:D-Ala-D-Ala carboxypeptidase family metallohydrolase [bacterium]|nr:D-Ala-D-Ala carboxypeptidase family metallohydrolase [bacterium]